MRLSLNWLREFTPFEGDATRLADTLTMLGLEVEAVLHPFAGLDKVVVGRILQAKKHPKADKLSVCTVDVGANEPLTIVCGAPNAATDLVVPVALVGARLPGGIEIKAAELKGVASAGMLCAEDELGLGDDHAGLMILDDDLRPGRDLVDALGLDEVVFDVSITPNRSDCLSVLGLAREVGAAFNLPVELPKLHPEIALDETSPRMRVEIADPDLCPVYQGRIIEAVKLGKSPSWLRHRLLAVGQRPLSNIVDITNYVMFELGQPLHAFDLDLLDGGKIRVAAATEGMEFVTLDNQTRKLNADDVLIWDGVKPVGLAGVMGGANSEMHDASVNVFLESAVFRPFSIRRTAKKLALPSEASRRFERGVDQPGSLFALNRAAQMMVELAGGRLVPGVTKDEPRPFIQMPIRVRPARAAKLLGVPVEPDFAQKTLESLGCSVEPSSADACDLAFSVTAPSARLDLTREVDFIEEIARMRGMDKIPPRLCAGGLGPSPGLSEFAFLTKVRDWGVGVGLNEAVNYSFVGAADLDRFNEHEARRIPIMNPLSEEQDVLRTSLAAGLVQSLKHNRSAGADRLRLFETAHIFWSEPESDTTAIEPLRLGVLLYGPRAGESWPRLSEADHDYVDLVGLVEHLCRSFRLPELRFAPLVDHPWIELGAEVFIGEASLGVIGRLAERIADAYEARKPVWIAELDLDLVKRLYEPTKPKFTPLPKFPHIKRDLTLISPKGEAAETLLARVRTACPGPLESAALVDLYAPEEGERRLTFRLTFRAPDRTLKDKDVDKALVTLTTALRDRLV